MENMSGSGQDPFFQPGDCPAAQGPLEASEQDHLLVTDAVDSDDQWESRPLGGSHMAARAVGMDQIGLQFLQECSNASLFEDMVSQMAQSGLSWQIVDGRALVVGRRAIFQALDGGDQMQVEVGNTGQRNDQILDDRLHSTGNPGGVHGEITDHCDAHETPC